MENRTEQKERIFSIELDSKENIRNLALSNGPSDGVLVEGTLGQLMEANFKEDMILEIVGKKGSLRVDLERDEIKANARSSAGMGGQ